MLATGAAMLTCMAVVIGLLCARHYSLKSSLSRINAVEFGQSDEKLIKVLQQKHADVFSLDMTLGEDGGIIRTLYRVVVGSEDECVIHLFPTQEGQSGFVNTLTKNGYSEVIVEINEGSTIERGKHLVAEGAKIAGKIVFGAVMKEVIKSLSILIKRAMFFSYPFIHVPALIY